MTTHELKTWPVQWESVNDGSKRVELRKADRDFQRMDVLVLKEWDPKTEEYTGRECRRRVTHVLFANGKAAHNDGRRWPSCGQHGFDFVSYREGA